MFNFSKFTLPAQIPDKEKKLTKIFIFTKAFIKPFKAPQRSVEIKN